MKSANNEVATALVPLIFKRKNQPAEIFFAPKCRKCGELILDLNDANVSTVGEIDAKPERIGTLGDAQVFLIQCVGAFCFHKECDRSEHKPWTDATCVFQADQRRSFERLGGH